MNNSNTELSTPKVLVGVLAVIAIALIIPELLLKFIANMYGPLFLLFYGVVIVTTLFICWQLIESENNQTQPLIPIPIEPDPYKIAYLKSASKGVAEVAIMNLIQKNYLQIDDKKITVNPDHSPITDLNTLERATLTYFSTYPRTTISLESIAEIIQPHTAIYQQQLIDENILNDEILPRRILIGSIASFIILGLGGFKLIVALTKGYHNVGYLIMMALVSMLILFCICSRQPITTLATAYLQQLQQAFSQLKQKIKTSDSSELEYNLAVALFGLSVLEETAYSEYQKIFFPVVTTSHYRSNSSSGGCSSSVSCGGGSSCSSGSSCGGGCGGGCGGCGG